MSTGKPSMAPAGRMLRRLIADRHITGEEIAEICDVSPSTVYRWTRGQSEPDFGRVMRLVRKVTVPEVRRGLVELFTAGLPLELQWAEGPTLKEPPPGADAMDMCLLTLSCLGQVMLNQRQAIAEDRYTDEAKADLQRLMAGAQDYLAAARAHLEQHPASRRKARPLPKAGGA